MATQKKRTRTTGLHTSLAVTASDLEPYFTARQLLAASLSSGYEVTGDQTAKVCSWWAKEGYLKVVGSAKIAGVPAAAYLYAKTRKFKKLLDEEQGVLYEAVPRLEPVEEESEGKGKLIPLPTESAEAKDRASWNAKVDEAVAAIDMLRTAILDLKEKE